MPKKIPCEVYSRVVGYLRPVQNWNKGKRQEFKERKVYEINNGSHQITSKRDDDNIGTGTE